jgi:hypothetical protein
MGLARLLFLLLAPSSAWRAEPTREDLLSLLSAGAPANVPADFECGWRGLAYEFALTLQPTRPAAAFSSIFDALQLSQCNRTFVAPPLSAAHPPAPMPAPAASTLYVDAASGSDANDGLTPATALARLPTAVLRARALPPPATILLRSSAPHRLQAPLQLTPADSGLTIANFPGEAPVLTSGLLLNTTWAPAPPLARPTATATASSGCTLLPGQNAMYGDWPSPGLVNGSAFPSAAACQAACSAGAPPAAGCTAFVYYSPGGPYGPQWDGMCFFRTDGRFPLTPEASITSGACTQPPPPPLPRNVYVADLAAGGTPLPPALLASQDFVLTLLVATGPGEYQRPIRARWPNCDPELCLWPAGWASGGAWAPPHPNTSTTVTHVPFPENSPGMNQDYWSGEGGPCAALRDGDGAPGPANANASYWCQPNGRVSGRQYFFRQPAAVTFTPEELPHAPYAAAPANGAVLHYWRPFHWYSSFARVGALATDPASHASTLSWTHGGFHGAEGADAGEDWYLDHIQEELDAPREFYLDAAAQLLYYWHNASAGTPPPPEWAFEAPLLPTLLDISGTPSTPVSNVTLQGLTFTGAAASYLMPHGVPAGGDWGVARVGAVTVEGAAGLAVRRCTFTRLDGNAVVLNGWSRGVAIEDSEFTLLGESAIVSWGRVDGADARALTQPWGTRVTRNLCSHIGLYEKQASCYFATLTGGAVVEGNIFHSVPRAAICFNDDMGGGSWVTQNLLFSTCLESQDHGPVSGATASLPQRPLKVHSHMGGLLRTLTHSPPPLLPCQFNSWGRTPYIINFPNGTPSGGVKPAMDELSYNFFVAGGGANSGAADNDDGSAFYSIHHNFFVYGGHKSNWGHAKRSEANLMAFALVYTSTCMRQFPFLPPASPGGRFAEAFIGNTCILAAAGDVYLDLGSDCTPGPALASQIVLANNTLLAPPGPGTGAVKCGRSTLSFAEWVASGSEPGTTLGAVPPTPVILGWAQELLGLKG